MKASVLTKVANLEIEQKPIPKVEQDRVLIKVELCGICGTDLLVYDGRFPVEIPYYNLGHEYIGKVVEIGKEVKRISVGERVVINPNYHCDLCYFCRRGDIEFCKNRRVFKTKSNGGFAEYVSIAEKLVYKVPLTLSQEEAIFVEPLSCCLHGVESLKIEAGASVAILGGGTMGLLALQLCRLKGAGKIVVSEPVKIRREMAKNLGADLVVDPLKEDVLEEIDQLAPLGIDIIIECAGGRETIEMALELVKEKGEILLLAIWPKKQEVILKPSLIVDKEIFIHGVIFGSFYMEKAIELLDKKIIQVKPLLTHRYKLDDLNKAMKKAKAQDSIKIGVNL